MLFPSGAWTPWGPAVWSHSLWCAHNLEQSPTTEKVLDKYFWTDWLMAWEKWTSVFCSSKSVSTFSSATRRFGLYLNLLNGRGHCSQVHVDSCPWQQAFVWILWEILATTRAESAKKWSISLIFGASSLMAQQQKGLGSKEHVWIAGSFRGGQAHQNIGTWCWFY